MNTFKDRLLSLFDKDTKPAHIAAKIGMSIPGFMRIFNDGFIPKSDGLIKIHEVTGCDLTWLLTGKGKPFFEYSAEKPASSDANLTSDNSNIALEEPINIDEFVFIPRYDIQAAARNGKYNYRNEEKNLFHLAFRKYWIDNFIRTNAQNLSVTSVKGDSMAGILNDGDIILVNHAQNTPDDGLYVLRVGESILVKRTQVLPEGKLFVTSTNEAYKPLTLNLKTEDVAIIGKVEWFGRRI